MPKIIESKLVITAEDKATEKIQKITEELGVLAHKIAGIKDIDLKGLAEIGRIGKARRGVIDAEWEEIDAERRRRRRREERGEDRDRKGVGIIPGVGLALQALRTAGTFARGAIGGIGMETVAQLMQTAGAGAASAFGGFGAVVGLPLLAGGLLLGLGKLITAPAKGWYLGTYGVGRRLGRPWMDSMMRGLAQQGISPMEFAQYMSQLENYGAQYAAPFLGRMKGFGLTPELAIPVLGAMTTAGLAGRRAPAEYDVLAKMLIQASRDVHSMPRFLEKLVQLTTQSSELLGTIAETRPERLIAIGRWFEGSRYAAVREQWPRLFGGVMGWVAQPGQPAKEMLLWGMLGPHQRALMNSLGAGPEAELIRKTRNPYVLMRMLRETPQASVMFLQQLAQMPGEMGAMALAMLPGMNIPMKAAMQLIEHIRTTPTPDMNWLQAELKKYEVKDPAAEVAKLVSTIESYKIDVGLNTITDILKTEETLISEISKVFKGDLFTGAVKLLSSGMTALVDLASGKETEFFRKLEDIIARGVRAALGFGGKKEVSEEVKAAAAEENRRIRERMRKFGADPHWHPMHYIGEAGMRYWIPERLR